MKIKIIVLILIMVIPIAVMAKESPKPISIEAIQVLKIAGQDGRAVIKTADGKMQIIKPGDSLGANAKVIEIAADRVVIEEKKGNETEKVIIRLENGKQHVERIRQSGEKPQQHFASPRRTG
jgi:hypothetical protein